MLVGLLIRHYKIYENAYFIPLTESLDTSLNVFIGNNGVGKSSVLEALDSFFNGKYWNVNNKGNKKDSYISPIFLIKKDEIKNTDALDLLSDFFWNVKLEDKTHNSNKQLVNGFFPLRDNLKEKYSPDDYYFFTIGTSYQKQSEAHIPYFYNHIKDDLGEQFVFELSKIKQTVIDIHNYIYIPIESTIKDILALEAREAQALMGKSMTDEIDNILTEKVFQPLPPYRTKITVLDVINNKLECFMNNINDKMEAIDGRYSYNKEGKGKKNLTPIDVRDIIVKTYFTIRTLKKDKKEIEELSSGEQRVALIDLAYTFLSSDDHKTSNTILAIDEPEASMHTSLCFEQFKRLSDLANKFGLQVITTTHWYGLLPMCQKGTLHHISNTKKIEIKSFKLSNIYEQRREFPDDVELKSVFDLISSILSLMKSKKSNWLICEGADDAMYLGYFLKDKIDNLTILPVGGCGNVAKIYNYLYAPMVEKVEKGLVNGKIYCLVDTDKEQGVFNLPTQTQNLSLVIRRLQRQNDLVHLVRPGQSGFYEKTEFEDCLAPDCFFDTISTVIDDYAPDEIQELFNEFEFDSKIPYSDINYRESCFKPTSMKGHEVKNELTEYLQSSSVKYKIASIYTKEDDHELDWINQIIEHFNGKNKA